GAPHSGRLSLELVIRAHRALIPCLERRAPQAGTAPSFSPRDGRKALTTPARQGRTALPRRHGLLACPSCCLPLAAAAGLLSGPFGAAPSTPLPAHSRPIEAACQAQSCLLARS